MIVGRAAKKKYQMEQKIFEAGMSLFQEKGFINTTLQDICEKAGVSKGTIFNYFSSKEDILAKFGRNQAIVLKQFADKLSPSMSTKEKIIAVLLEDIRLVKKSEFDAKTALKGISEGGEAVYQFELKNRKDLSNIYKDLLIAGQKSKTFNESLIADLIVTVYFHVLDTHFYRHNRLAEIEESLIESVNILFNGIKDAFN
ncbi:TetR/AcrR family transcriptional regulator [Bacillus sp. Bva_UNVM-123]|uniref:TetR/AcrR family transcriptional regulator n=1 Tax=Bacillus sp. Bva_UNVM-123 TaxID=2829798 RepID=UPI00391EEEE1